MSDRQRTRLAVLFVAMTVAACASPGRGPGMGNPNLITEAEIQAQGQAGVANLYELVERTRPRWLQSRGDRSINLQTTILVYQNMQAVGGVDVLRDFPLANIRSLQFLDAAQAGQLPGGGGQHVEGAIVISTTG